ARHGHKSKNRRFDGFKTHISVEPESEIICETTATKANVHDHDAIEELVKELESEEVESDDGEAKVVIGDGAYGDGPSRRLLRN
ncbi:MAG: transposase, partial [Firmicutes bacterium]|nr:transposase [Bacillota bacterium]